MANSAMNNTVRHAALVASARMFVGNFHGFICAASKVKSSGNWIFVRRSFKNQFPAPRGHTIAHFGFHLRRADFLQNQLGNFSKSKFRGAVHPTRNDRQFLFLVPSSAPLRRWWWFRRKFSGGTTHVRAPAFAHPQGGGDVIRRADQRLGMIQAQIKIPRCRCLVKMENTAK